MEEIRAGEADGSDGSHRPYRDVRLEGLRNLLRESFGCAILAAEPAGTLKNGPKYTEGVQVLDSLFPEGRIIECFGGPCCGKHSLAAAVLGRSIAVSSLAEPLGAWISTGPLPTASTLHRFQVDRSRVLFVRVEGAARALAAAELLLRQERFVTILLSSPRWWGIPKSAWHRLSRQVTRSSARLILLDEMPLRESVVAARYQTSFLSKAGEGGAPRGGLRLTIEHTRVVGRPGHAFVLPWDGFGPDIPIEPDGPDGPDKPDGPDNEDHLKASRFPADTRFEESVLPDLYGKRRK